MNVDRGTVEKEEKRLATTISEMRRTLAGEVEDRRALNEELAAFRKEKLVSQDWKEKNAIEEEMGKVRARMAGRSYQDTRVLLKPYFGILEMEDDDLGGLSYCLGKGTFHGESGKVLVIDWRDAPISRLYYEYDAGEAYDEDIRGRERNGVISAKRQVEITGGNLQSISEKGMTLVRDAQGSWREPSEMEGASSARKAASGDHHLPEITALIGREQFQAITAKDAGTFVLQGGAGSGKTTVGLHRIAYLLYKDPERFIPSRMLVVMFNKSLQAYISRVLPDLGVKGVGVKTFHQWAGEVFRRTGLKPRYGGGTIPPSVNRIKRSRKILQVMDAYVEALLAKSRQWLVAQLKQEGPPDIALLLAFVEGADTMPDFMRLLHHHHPLGTLGATDRLRRRLSYNLFDLHSALSDRELLEAVGLAPGEAGELIRYQDTLRTREEIDFSDTGILVYLLQQKGTDAALPGFAHVMVDEAQDLSPVELAVLVRAADEDRCVTICGDMAQQIKSEMVEESGEGFGGAVRDLSGTGGGQVHRADVLNIGYRATRPIMELAWKVLDSQEKMAVPRKGEPVTFTRTETWDETVAETENLLLRFLEDRPGALMGVVCKFKREADTLFQALKDRVPGLRRHQRDDFTFIPGAIVTNAHQVKGLEFSEVIAVNPGQRQYRDNPADRMLLHVVITRASDRLFMVGHEPFAYGIVD